MKLYLGIRHGNHIDNDPNQKDTLILLIAEDIARAIDIANLEISNLCSSNISNTINEINAFDDVSDNVEGKVSGPWIDWGYSFNLSGTKFLIDEDGTFKEYNPEED